MTATLQGTFICVCPPKSLVFDDEEELVARRKTSVEFSDVLNEFEFQGEIIAGEGGGLAVSKVQETHNVKTWSDGHLLSAFCGHLENKDFLTSKMENKEGESQERNEAEIAAYLYSKYGRKCVARLRGQFSLVVFDSRLVRVFAARDPSGTIPLNQVRLLNGTVIIANFDVGSFECYCETVTEIPPGHYVYGGRRCQIPEQYSPQLEVLETQKQSAVEAAARALEGIVPGRAPELRCSPKTECDASGKPRRRTRTRRRRKGQSISMDGEGDQSPMDISALRTSFENLAPVNTAFPRRTSQDGGRRTSNDGSRRTSFDGISQDKTPGRSGQATWWRRSEDRTAASRVPEHCNDLQGHNSVGKGQLRHSAESWHPAAKTETPTDTSSSAHELLLLDEMDKGPFSEDLPSPIKEDEVEELSTSPLCSKGLSRIPSAANINQVAVEEAVKVLHRIASGGSLKQMLEFQRPRAQMSSMSREPSCRDLIEEHKAMKRVNSSPDMH